MRCTFISIPPPLAWVVIGLLKGDFYACAMWPDKLSLETIQNECPLTNFTSPLKKILPNLEPSYILPACVALDRKHNVDYSDCSSIVARNLRQGSPNQQNLIEDISGSARLRSAKKLSPK